ncbi:MAG: 2-haloalkanoic acid dehalogenase [Rhodothermaceae bacterium]|nr:MAG: 2-haloalkanoic acid dehalogenase [Rhodothermaceae bacterium]
MAPPQALTVDFWNTLVVAQANGPARRARRLAHLQAVVARHQGTSVPEDRIEAALVATVRRFESIWKTRHQTPGADAIVRDLWPRLHVDVDEEEHRETVRIFEEGILEHPPALVEGAAQVLRRTAERYPLALISDTMFSPGRVIRQLLDRYELLPCFRAFVFSDETGFSKPDVRAFHRAAEALSVRPEALLHVGDLRRTDVAGALAAGARAVLFTGVHTDTEPAPEPHHVLTDWRDLPDLL